MMTRFLKLMCVLFCLMVSGFLSMAFAQSGTATVTGTVVDKTGAVIPQAKVVFTEEASGVRRTVLTNGHGFFSFVAIPAASYDLEVSAPSFKALKRTGIAVHINDQIELPGLQMVASAESTTVTVTAETTEITPTTSGEVSYTLDNEQIHNMNLQTRSAVELLGLIPGSLNSGNFTQQGYNNAQAGFTQNASTFAVNGNRFDQVQFVSDGISVTDANTAGSVAVTPNIDMIAELKVEASAYSASEPNGPAVVATETKSGGQTFHGEAYLTARNYNLDAMDWQQKSIGFPKAQSSLYYPGAQLGGPVLLPGRKRGNERLFFFAAAEFAQQHVDQVPRKTAVPTAAGSPGATGNGMRNGDFSDWQTLGSLSNAANNYEYWGASTYPCGSGQYYCSGSGIINPSYIDKGGQILLNAFPLPNVNPLTHNGNNLITDFVTSNPRNQENLKLDWAATDKLHFSGRYNHENESVPWPYGPYNLWNNVPYPVSQTGKDASNSISLSMDNVLTSSLTNAATLGYTRFTLKEQLSNLNAMSGTSLGYPYNSLFSTSDPLLPNVGFEESQQTGYPSDLPVKSYDFQAPFGEFGHEAESLRMIKLFNYFLLNFGEMLSPMPVIAPQAASSGPDDLVHLRCALRMKDGQGFLFVNNHVRQYSMPQQRNVQFAIVTKGRTTLIPQRPVNVPSGAFFIWPVGSNLSGAVLRYSTAQPIAALTNGNDRYYFFSAIKGIRSEFSFAKSTDVVSMNARVRHDATGVLVDNIVPGPKVAITARTSTNRVHIVVLSREQSESFWFLMLKDGPHALLSRATLWEESGYPAAEQISGNEFEIAVFPRLDSNLRVAEMDGIFARYHKSFPSAHLNVSIRLKQNAGAAPVPQLGPVLTWRKTGVAQAPEGDAFVHAARWELTLPRITAPGINNVYMRIHYKGDIARLKKGGILLVDNFYNGDLWSIGLNRFISPASIGHLELQILPLAEHPPVYWEPEIKKVLPAKGCILQSIEIVPEYEWIIR